MFKKILFPTDFTEEAKTELSCITSIPGIKEIILFHVIRKYPMPMAESLAVEAAEHYLQKAEAYIATLNPDIFVSLDETTSTDITGAILEKAEEKRVDLIVIHANMKGVMTGMLLSHVSTKILCRISKINIMIMPNKLVGALTGKTYEKFCPMIFSRILCPTNFSENSLKAIALAGTLKSIGEILLLHIVPEGEDTAYPETAVKNAERRISDICDHLIIQGIKARIIVATGKPEIEIARIAQYEDVSLIWMRSTAQGCLHDFFFGSMLHDVIMNAKQPVIVIRSDL